MPDNWSDYQVDVFLAEAARRAMRDVGDAYEATAHDQFPVLDLLRTRPPGEGWSMPPGALRASARADVQDGATGPVMLGMADPVIRFRGKKRHRIRVSKDEVLRGMADRLRAKGYE